MVPVSFSAVAVTLRRLAGKVAAVAVEEGRHDLGSMGPTHPGCTGYR